MKVFGEKIKIKSLIFGIVLFAALVSGGIFFYLTIIETMPQPSIDLFKETAVPKAGERILVFTPHPDDESLAAGGYITEAENVGANVKIVLVTDGNKHGKKDTRYAEFQQATSDLGVPSNNLTFLNYADGALNKTDANTLYSSLKTQIDSFSPEVIISSSPLDEHPDHDKVGETVAKIISDQKLNVSYYQYLVHSNYYPQPRKFDMNDYLLPPVRILNNDWQKFILSSDAVAKKNKAVREYKSQLRTPILKSLMLSLIRKNELFIVAKEGN